MTLNILTEPGRANEQHTAQICHLIPTQTPEQDQIAIYNHQADSPLY